MRLLFILSVSSVLILILNLSFSFYLFLLFFLVFCCTNCFLSRIARALDGVFSFSVFLLHYIYCCAIAVDFDVGCPLCRNLIFWSTICVLRSVPDQNKNQFQGIILFL